MYWTNIKIFHAGPDYLSDVLEDVRRAQSSIRIEVYIFDICEPTLRLLDELEIAKKRGCVVQLLIDGFGSYGAIPNLTRICQQKGIQLQIYQPMPRSLTWIKRFFLVFTLRFLNLLRKLNRRNHRKLILIDDTKAYVGSLNLTSVHFYFNYWRDTAVAVEGPGIKELVLSFQTDWEMSFKKIRLRHPLLKGYNPRKSYVRINTSLRTRWLLYFHLLHKIKSARSRVLITSAYFLPKRSLLRALKKVAERGVKVEILVPGPSDVPIVKWAGLELAHSLIKSGVKIYEYQPRILHAKILIVDDWATIGSTNLNHRSLLHDLELEVVLQDKKSISELIDQWHQDIKLSHIFDEKKYSQVGFLKKLLSRMAFRLRYFL